MTDPLSRIASKWLEARNVIADALMELIPMTRPAAFRIAEAIIARLAHHKPPILIEMQPEDEG